LSQAARSPFTTTRTTRRIGLGLPDLAQAAEATNGELRIESKLGNGTRVVATFHQSHIDCIPLGDIGETIMTLIVGFPDVDFCITYRRNGAEFLIDSRIFREVLNGLPFSHPEAIGAQRSLVNAGLHDLESAAATPAEGNGVLVKGM
jgi:hypothetical protein